MQLGRIAALMALVACAPANESPPTLPSGADDTCGARANAGLIGQPATMLEKVLIVGMVRVIRPGEMITMDYSPGRINFMISDEETIRQIYCG